MRTAKITHPKTGATVEVPESAVSMHMTAGWRPVEETQPEPAESADTETQDTTDRSTEDSSDRPAARRRRITTTASSEESD